MVARAQRKKRTRLKPDVRREQLLNVGLEVFAKKGLTATHLADVAEAAGVTKAIVYHYFENKQAFFDAIAEREMRLVVGRIREALEGVPLEDNPQEGGRAFFEYLEERPHGFAALMSHAPIAWHGDDRLSELRRTFYEAAATAMRHALGNAGDVDTDGGLIAHAALGGYIFAAQYWLHDESGTPARGAAEQLANLITRGITAFLKTEEVKPPDR
ncbi:MAG: TetR/AcrR family transcriptional regulator [Myxococcota bacterium]